MFTGLVHSVGTLVASKLLPGGARELSVDIEGLGFSPDIGASIAINGVCQTVTAVNGWIATFCAVEETVKRSTLGRLPKGCMVNLEPSLKVGESLDGHFVLGHVDAVGRVTEKANAGSSEIWYFSMPANLKGMFAEKGSITIDGISLTISAVFEDTFSVSLIPHTIATTRLKYLGVGAEVNLEVDVLARYIARQLSAGNVSGFSGESKITTDFLAENGFL